MAFTSFPISTLPATAARVANTPSGSISATNVQDAINELALGGGLEGVFNVKDYGATGDGVTDDTAAIQAAVDAALQAIDDADGNGFYGIIFFPPGHYTVTASIEVPNSEHDRSIIFEGCGSASQIGGDFDDYIFKNLFEQPNNGITGFRGLSIGNAATTIGSGAISWGNTLQGAFYEHLSLSGFCAIDMTGPFDGSNFAPTVNNCLIVGNGVDALENSVGVRMATGGGGSLTNCIIRGYNQGIRINSGLIYGVDFEANMMGVAVGADPSIDELADEFGYGAGSLPGNVTIMNSTFEANGVAIYGQAGRLVVIGCTAGADSFCSPMTAARGGVEVTGNTVNGSPIITNITPDTTGMFPHQQLKQDDINGTSYDIDTVDSASQVTLTTNWSGTTANNRALFCHRLSSHILRMHGQNNANVFMNSQFGGPCEDAIVEFDNAGMGTFINAFFGPATGGSEVTWILPAALGYDFIGYPFGGLGETPPDASLTNALATVTTNITDPWEGMTQNINDCNSTTFRAIAATGGSNHVEIRWDGTNWRISG